MIECELISICGFFKKYEDTLNLACHGLVKMYCKGPKGNECLRKEYRMRNGTAPTDSMLPSGQTIT